MAFPSIPCHSALSAVISHGDEVSKEYLTLATKKEHDYMFFSEVSSSSSSPSVFEGPDHQVAVKETDLHLGLELGPSKGFSASSKSRGFTDQQNVYASLFGEVAVETHGAAVDWGSGRVMSSSRNAGMLSKNHSCSSQTEGLTDPPHSKLQIVGWPPLRPLHKHILSGCARRGDGDEEASEPAIYVKVNMDGNPIGRKVDLNAVGSYEGLILALEEMFQCRTAGMHGLHNSKNILTYEDEEGDWLLAGDVPWRMFIRTAKRLRIMRETAVVGSC